MSESYFRPVDVRTWGDGRFRGLSPIPPSGQGLWLFLLTGPHTSALPGLWSLWRGQACEILRWSPEEFDGAWGEIAESGMAEADWSAGLIWLPSRIHYSEPRSPSNVQKWSRGLLSLPECPLRDRAFLAISRYCEGRGEAFLAALPPAVRGEIRKAPPIPQSSPPPSSQEGTGHLPDKPGPSNRRGKGEGEGERQELQPQAAVFQSLPDSGEEIVSPGEGDPPEIPPPNPEAALARELLDTLLRERPRESMLLHRAFRSWLAHNPPWPVVLEALRATLGAVREKRLEGGATPYLQTIIRKVTPNWHEARAIERAQVHREDNAAAAAALFGEEATRVRRRGPAS